MRPAIVEFNLHRHARLHRHDLLPAAAGAADLALLIRLRSQLKWNRRSTPLPNLKRVLQSSKFRLVSLYSPMSKKKQIVESAVGEDQVTQVCITSNFSL